MENKSSSKVMIIVAILLLVVGVGVVAYALTRDNKNDTTDTVENETSQQTEQSETETKATTEPTTTDTPVIVFTDDGFSQSTYTFPAGKAIKVDNQSSMDMQFSSDDHPTHRDHSELNMSVLGAGESGTFTPPGKGTYGFHDHINDQFEGVLRIE